VYACKHVKSNRGGQTEQLPKEKKKRETGKRKRNLNNGRGANLKTERWARVKREGLVED